jgi:hypothetical protein
MNRRDITGWKFNFLGAVVEMVFIKHIPTVLAIDWKRKTYRMEA